MTTREKNARIWRRYDEKLPNDAPREAIGEAFARFGFHSGQLSPHMADQVRRVVQDAELLPLLALDSTPDFVTARFSDEIIKRMNDGAKFRRFDARQTWLLDDMLDSMKDEVAACLTSPWRTLAIRSWATPAGVGNHEMYDWHTDGFVREIFKIMIYLTPADEATGTLEYRLDGQDRRHVSAAPGSWVLFRNSEVVHRGAAGKLKERLCIEVTLTRAPTFDVRARYPGQNAHWPMFPWVGAVDGYVASCVRDLPKPQPAGLWARLARHLGI